MPEIVGCKTKIERLALVNEAIESVLYGGQSYKIGSRSLTRADLSTLIAERNKLESDIAAGQSTALFPGTFVAEFGIDNRR